MYFGTKGLLVKMAMGGSALVSGGLVQLFGATLGVQLTGPAAALVVLMGLLAFSRYPEEEVMAGQGQAAVESVPREKGM